MSIPQETTRSAREPRTCLSKTLDLGLEGYSECPRTGPAACEFAVPFGYGFLCAHTRQGTSTMKKTPRGPALEAGPDSPAA